MKIKPKKIIASFLISTSLLGTTILINSKINSQIANAATANQNKQMEKKKPSSAPTKPKGGKSGNSVPGNSTASAAKLSGSKTITGQTTLDSNQIVTTSSNQSAVYVKKGGQLTLNNATINKTGNTTSEDNSNFYGQNAGIVTTKQGRSIINNLTEKTNANGANAVFATGSGANIKINKANITTYKDSSRGLDATQTGKINANDITITTHGGHSATLANDRGGGIINVDKGTLNTSGDGSPIIYSTGTINVNQITGNAKGAEAAVIEGANSINVKNSNLTANKNNGVMLYQSMSGDAKEGTANFSMTNGSLTSNVKDGSTGTSKNNGALFYVTNTKANINLNNVKLTNASDTLIRIAGDRWGTSGKNGGQLTFNANQQTLNGNVEVAKGSTLNLNLTNQSKLDGTINTANTAGKIILSLDSSSQWNVTKNSYITAFKGNQSSIKSIQSNGNNVYYDKSNSTNNWLNGKTYELSGGGKLIAK